QTAELRERARRRSGRWSRDLSDWIAVQCKGDLLSTASYLQGLEMVDLVEIEARVNQAGDCDPAECSETNDGDCPGPAAVPNDSILSTGDGNAGGVTNGAIDDCVDLINEWLGDCVGTPPCAGGTAVWDWGCLTMANFLCTPSVYAPSGGAWTTCGDPTGGNDPTGNGTWSTFTAGHLVHHQLQSAAALTGSREPLCCDVVCAVNYLCCTLAWDADCAASALTIPDCYITRDYFVDFSVTAPDDPSVVSIYDLNPDTADFDQGNPYDPSGEDTPYYGDSNLLLGETFNPGAGIDFPIGDPDGVDIDQPDPNPGLDNVEGRVAFGSMPLALWGTRLRQLPPPGTPDNPDFFPFMRTTTFLGGGLDVGYMDFLAEALFGVEDGLTGGPIPGQVLPPDSYSVKVGLVDLSMFINHEEFLVGGESKIILEPGQGVFVLDPTPVACECGGFEATAEDCCARCALPPNNPTACVDVSDPTFPPDGFVVYPQHGTAVMSILVANPDTKGVSGLCPESEAWFFPALSSTGLARTAAALTGAAFYLTGEGEDGLPEANVCVIPLESAGGFQPLNSIDAAAPEQGQALRDVLSQGSDAGLTWVLSAGNGARIIDPAQVREADAPDTPDTTSCIVVGGVWPGFQLQLPTDSLFPTNINVLVGQPPSPNHVPAAWPGNDYCRVGMSNFLNPEPEEGTNNLTISGWGSGICAAGYGDLFLGDDDSSRTGYDGTVQPGERGQLRRYTANFDGTSGAAAMIGGAAVLLQQFAKLQFEGIGIPADQLKNVLTGSAPGQAPASSIFPQCGQASPPTQSENPIFGDTNGEDTEIASVRGFPNLRFMALEVNAGEWFDPSNDAEVELITGKPINEPNNYSVKEVDAVYLKARSDRRRGSSGGFGPSVPYPLPNRVVDVQVARNTGFLSPDDALKINVEGSTTILGSGLTLAMVFVYNAVTNRWELWLPEDNEIQVLPGGVPNAWVVQSPGCSPASAYVVSDEGALKVFTRVVTMAGGTGSNYQCWHDQIKVQINAAGELYTVGDCGGGIGGP
ncbi:MAG: hypothetical protein FJ270_07540, partial [Planctomycetes bacterium]|nr:hypothetical protein [Planctomycetota bacterium]